MKKLKNIIKKPTSRRTSKADKVDLFYVVDGKEYTLANYVDDDLADEVIGRSGLRSNEEIQWYIDYTKKRLTEPDWGEKMNGCFEGELKALYWVMGMSFTEASIMAKQAAQERSVVRNDTQNEVC